MSSSVDEVRRSFLNGANSKGKLCDPYRDSKWSGGAAENGHYVKLNDFSAKEKISMDDFMPATVVGLCRQWPRIPDYWRCRRWATRSAGLSQGWFARPEFRPRFKKKYERDLARLKTWDESSRSPSFSGQGDRRQ